MIPYRVEPRSRTHREPSLSYPLPSVERESRLGFMLGWLKFCIRNRTLALVEIIDLVETAFFVMGIEGGAMKIA